jgi:large subunit ribosomal protein L18
MAFSKSARRDKIRGRIRKTISGTADRPRLSVYRSNKEIYAQVINDVNGLTIASASSRELKSSAPKTETAKEVGMKLAEKAKAAGVESVSFDRGGYLYHGRVMSLAEGAREGGLKF